MIGWVSDFGAESEIPSVPAIDMDSYLRESAKDAEGLLQFIAADCWLAPSVEARHLETFITIHHKLKHFDHMLFKFKVSLM